jgi:hypothetical protein
MRSASRCFAFSALSLGLGACGNDREEAGDVEGGTTLVTSECGVEERIAVRGANHVVGGITYPTNPPVGGDHDPCWAPWGVHDVTVPTERWVHNLEHGGVVFLHDCADGCPGDEKNLAELLDFVRTQAPGGREAGHLLSTPYPGLPGRFAAVSWGHRLVLDCIDVQAAVAFYGLRVADKELPEGRITSAPPAECQ